MYSYKDILKSEILEDGVSVTTTSRTSQIGGVLGGGVGAVVGGLSGKIKTTDSIKKIQLQVVVNDPKKTYFRITFGHFGRESSISIKDAYEETTHWYNLTTYIIKEIYNSNTLNSTQAKMEGLSTSSGYSVSDELSKLNQLCKEGILSEEEFQVQKQKILNR